MDQEDGVKNLRVVRGPDCGMIFHSLGSILYHDEQFVAVPFEFEGIPDQVRLVITGVEVFEGIEGGIVELTAAYPWDACRICPARPEERNKTEFVFPEYQHLRREGRVLIPLAYRVEMMKRQE